MNRVAVASCLALACAGCFKHTSSKGGGQISEAAADRAAAAPESPYDVAVPPGYRVELVADQLSVPTGVAFGDGGRIFVVESGYSTPAVSTKPRLIELVDGQPRELATGAHAPWLGVAYDEGALFVAQGGAADGGRIVRFDLTGDRVKETVLVDGLPSLGDHQTNGPVVHDGWVYFGQGTATNAGVVGEDAFTFGWLERSPTFHDTPCRSITLVGTTFESGDPRTPADDQVVTGAFQPFGQPGTPGQIVPGQLPCNGAVMRVPARGGKLELVAWGFRNPFGLAFNETGKLYVTDNGYDVRGSRPVFGAADMLWRVDDGAWYGWPDFAEGRPLTREFYREAGGQPRGFLIADQPGDPPHPAAYLPVHASADGFDFSRSDRFGHVGWAFIALFGDMAGQVGKVTAPVGFSVVRADPRSGRIEDFARNRADASGPSSKLKRRGLERPIAARFDRSGEALYVVDFGVLRIGKDGPEPSPASGALWRITRSTP